MPWKNFILSELNIILEPTEINRVLEILKTQEHEVFYMVIQGNVTDGSPFLGLVPPFSDVPPF